MTTSRKLKRIIVDKCYKCGSGVELQQVAIRRVEHGEIIRDKRVITIEALCRKCVDKLKKRDKGEERSA